MTSLTSPLALPGKNIRLLSVFVLEEVVRNVIPW
jgi:hypothetical protein